MNRKLLSLPTGSCRTSRQAVVGHPDRQLSDTPTSSGRTLRQRKTAVQCIDSTNSSASPNPSEGGGLLPFGQSGCGRGNGDKTFCPSLFPSFGGGRGGFDFSRRTSPCAQSPCTDNDK